MYSDAMKLVHLQTRKLFSKRWFKIGHAASLEPFLLYLPSCTDNDSFPGC